jgi:predicted S18 family serine protease
MTQPNDLPPLPELPRADGDFSENNGALSFTYTQAKMQAYATAYGLQCAEAAVERYAAQVRQAVQEIMDQEKSLRNVHEKDERYVQHQYAICTCIDIKERLLQIK